MPLRQGQSAANGRRLLSKTAVFFGFLAFYAATTQCNVSWQDSGYFQYRVLSGDYTGDFGLALAHPLYIGLARAFVDGFPVALQIYAVNLFSGVGMALALTLLSAMVWRLTANRWSVTVAVLTLGLSHMAWWMSTTAEVYTWSLAGLMGELYCLLRFEEKRQAGWLIALFGANGAHAAIHNFAFLNLPFYGVLLLMELMRTDRAPNRSLSRSWGRGSITLGCVAVAWVTGAWPLIWQVINDLKIGGDPVSTVKSLLFGSGYERAVLGLGQPAWRQVAANLALAGVSLLTPCWLFALRGWTGDKEFCFFKRCLLGLTVVHAAFWMRYFVPDQATFVLPTLGLLAVWVGLGGARVDRGSVRWALTVTAGCICAVAGPLLLNDVAQRTGAAVVRNRVLPFRDEMRYWLLPWKQTEDSAARFVSEVGKQLVAGDVLVADATVAGPLLAARVAGKVKDEWQLVTPWSGETEGALRALLRDGTKRVFVVSPVPGYAPPMILEAAKDFERAGVLYRIRVRDREAQE